ncbi:chromosomal replication initiator protein DnaA [Caproicibacterium sp. NSD3]
MDFTPETWELICNYCRSQITEVAYTTWISRIEPINLDFSTGTATLKVPNEFHKQTILHYYADLLKDAFQQVFNGQTINLDLQTPDEIKEAKPQEDKLPMDDYEYTFESFIVGPSNKFAHAACMAVATQPASRYNPLFIYGNSGLGKTHLLYAICNQIKKDHPEMNILYIKGDDFTNELIEGIRRGNTAQFHNFYRNADILLVDDIQFIAGKESTQEEFFHTFNTLYESKKQIVLTSDRPPKEIATLEDRLRSRFEWGLTADIQPPDFETRIAIIKRKEELLDIHLDNTVEEYIANQLKSNIRQLEGAVKKMKAYSIIDVPPNISTARAAISDIITNSQPISVTVEKIIDEVARTYGTVPEDIRSGKRNSNISKARQVAMYVIKEVLGMSTSEIGDEFGGRDHSTVVYAIQQVEKNQEKNNQFKDTVNDIIKNIRDR